MPHKRFPFFYEIYTKHPVTKEGGWDIHVGFVTGAPDREGAKRALKKAFGRFYDGIIQLYEVTEVESLYADQYAVIPYNRPRDRKIFQGEKISHPDSPSPPTIIRKRKK